MIELKTFFIIVVDKNSFLDIASIEERKFIGIQLYFRKHVFNVVSLYSNVSEYFEYVSDNHLLLYFFIHCYNTLNSVKTTHIIFNIV
jgi:hypothetical protein